MNIKYGIQVPRTIKKGKKGDDEAGNTMWQDAIDMEMNMIMLAFDLVDWNKPPPGYT